MTMDELFALNGKDAAGYEFYLNRRAKYLKYIGNAEKRLERITDVLDCYHGNECACNRYQHYLSEYKKAIKRMKYLEKTWYDIEDCLKPLLRAGKELKPVREAMEITFRRYDYHE